MTPFSCRDEQFVGAENETIKYTLKFINLVGQTAVAGLDVLVCPQFDASCEAPLTSAKTDSLGTVVFDMPIGFRGHAYSPPPASDPMLADHILHVYPPPNSDFIDPDPVLLTSLAALTQLATLGGSEVVPGAGHIFFGTFDCNDNRLDKVTVLTNETMDGTETVYIGSGGQPDGSLTSTGLAGQGAILNVPTGFITVRGIHEDEGTLFEQAVLVGADTITLLRGIIPSP